MRVWFNKKLLLNLKYVKPSWTLASYKNNFIGLICGNIRVCINIITFHFFPKKLSFPRSIKIGNDLKMKSALTKCIQISCKPSLSAFSTGNSPKCIPLQGSGFHFSIVPEFDLFLQFFCHHVLPLTFNMLDMFSGVFLSVI